MKKSIFLGVRAFLVLSAVMMFASAAVAGRPDVEVKKGNWKEIIAGQGTANLVLDFSTCQVGFIDDGEFEKDKEIKPFNTYLKDRGDDFVRDWPGDEKKIAEYFAVQFNRKNKKGIQVAADAADAKYTFKIVVEKLDVGNPVGIGFSPKSGGAIFTGKIIVIDNASKEEVCEVAINEIKGVSTFSETARIGVAFTELGKAVAKLK